MNKYYVLFIFIYKCCCAIEDQINGSNYDFKTLNSIRQLEYMSAQNITSRALKVMNYNVLAQDLIESHTELYQNHTSAYLEWEYRSRILMEQITAFLPDILALQEVQESHIVPFYKQLEKYGYRGIFKRRAANKSDGCALYYMSTLLDMVDYKTIDYYQPHIDANLLNRPNVAIIARLKPTAASGMTNIRPRITNRELIVANTHLLYNPRRTDVKLAQLQLLLAEIYDLVKKQTFCKEPGILLLGDLNSTPDSPVVKLLEDGKVLAENLRLLSPESGISKHCTYTSSNKYLNQPSTSDNDKLKLTNGDEFCYKDQCTNKEMAYITHNFHFDSAYNWKSANNSQLATTFQGRWVLVDYMFHSSSMKLISRLQLPTVEQCEYEIGYIPNKVSPSDHFPLAACFIVD